MVVNGIENELIIITKQTFDAFLRSDFPADLIALYNFYYYTAKWQETNQPKCTTGYTADGLKWSEAKVRRAKKELMRLGLVEDVQQQVNGKVTGCFIKLNYILKQETIHHTNDFPQGGNESNHPYDFPQGGVVHRVENLQTNALSPNNINALSPDNINALSPDKRKTKKGFDAVVEEYTTNADLKAAIFDFIQFRKAIKAPLTDRALTLCLNKLDKLANNDLEKIAVLNQSIERGWKGLFEVKDNVSYHRPTTSENNTVPSEDDYDFERGSFWK